MMKTKNINLKTGILILGLLFILQSLEAQDWRIGPKVALKNQWDINVNAGLASFYGDISSYDNNYIGKLKYESGFATSIIVTKRFSDVFGISGQVLTGKTIGRKNNITIQTRILEYNMHLRIDLVQLFTNNSKSRLKIDAYCGIGNFIFESVREEFVEGEQMITEHSARVPEFLFILGSGLSYDLSQKISINSEISIKQCQNDKVDILVAGVDYDYYSYLSFGITYHIRSLKRGHLRNKARIAHNNWFKK